MNSNPESGTAPVPAAIETLATTLVQLSTRASELLRPHKISVREFLVLTVVAPTGSLGMKEIREKTGMTYGVASQVFRRLRGKGYIVQFRMTQDQRSLFVYITEEGKRALRQILASETKGVQKDANQTFLFSDMG